MIPATWKKIIADVWGNKARSILVALSIAVGIFAVGVLITTIALVRRSMQADYLSVNPHTARIYTQDFDESLLDTLRGLPEVETVDASYNIWLKIASTSGKLYPINLNSLESLETFTVDQPVYEAGAQTLADGEIYLERQGAAGLGLSAGDTASLALKDGTTATLKVAGTVHDVNGNPFRFTSSTSGFVTPATMAALGGSERNNFVNLVTTGSHTDAVHVKEMANRVAEVLTTQGVMVYNVNINNPPGQHPAQSIVDTVMALLGALSVLVVFLSAFLVTNTVTALMGQQVRQIGVMKALGATFFQVTGVYLGLVLIFGLLALLIAVPLGGLAAYGMTSWMMGMVNANATPFSIPLETVLVQLLIGLAVPVLAALMPIIGGARRTIRQALTNYGIEEARPRKLFLLRMPHAAQSTIRNLHSTIFNQQSEILPRPLLLSLRNTFRRRGRLLLTLATLILGGAIFIAMLGVRESMYAEMDQTFSYFQSDVNVTLAQSYPIADLEAAVADLPGVTASESWNAYNANVVRPDGVTSDLIVLYVPPDNTQLVEAVITDGRWLNPGEANAIVVSNHFIGLRPEVKVGDTLRVRWTPEGQELPNTISYQVVGIFRVAGNFPAPITYITTAGLAALGGDPGKANELKLVTDQHTQARQDQVLLAAQARFKDLGLEATLQTGKELITQQRGVIDILITLLLVMGLLIAVVGGLGLMGTMGMNVLERTREIGVLRSIGAENWRIFQLVLVEGVLIGLISWIGSGLLAIPITRLFDSSLGQSLMTVPLVYIYSLRGLLIWLVIVLVLSALSSLLPARSAVRLAVRDVLAYE